MIPLFQLTIFFYSFSSDSSYSGSRTPSLASHSDKEDTKFPILLPHKLKGKSKSKILSAGLRDNEMLETPVAEEGEEQEVKLFLKEIVSQSLPIGGKGVLKEIASDSRWRGISWDKESRR